MESLDLLRALEISQSDFKNIPGVIIQRLTLLGAKNPCIAFSCLHDPAYYVVYSADDRWIARGQPFFVEPGKQLITFEIEHPELRELSVLESNITVQFVGGYEGAPDAAMIEHFVADIIARIVHRYRSLIRRLFIEAKVGSDDIGTFCYRLLNEYLNAVIGPYEAMSVFVFDKWSKQIRLRSQFPKRDDKRYLTDVSVPAASSSWLNKAFLSGSPIAEYADAGILKVGRTREANSISYRSRLYWPIQIHHRPNWSARQRSKDPVVGVFRLSNAKDCGNQ